MNLGRESSGNLEREYKEDNWEVNNQLSREQPVLGDLMNESNKYSDLTLPSSSLLLVFPIGRDPSPPEKKEDSRRNRSLSIIQDKDQSR